MSEYQQSKVTAVESKSTNIIGLTVALVSSSDVDEMFENYNNVELNDLFASTYYQYSGDSSFTCSGKSIKNALTSFQSGLEEMGSIVETGTPSSEVDDDEIIVTVPVTGVQANGSVELIFTNDIYLEMTSCTLNIDRSMGQLMGRAALNTVIGMGTVFVVLILISLIIYCFKYIPKLQAAFSKSKKAEPAAAPAPAAPVTSAPAPVEEELADDTELVAVIAAAIAAYEGTSVEGFRVRSIKRSGTNKWKKA